MCIEESWKGPVKRHLLLNLMKINGELPGYKQIKRLRDTDAVLSLEEFQTLNRKIIYTYLNNFAQISVITSKKMKNAVWKEHLQKIRDLKIYFRTSDLSNSF